MLLRISLRCVYVFMYYQAQPTEMGIAQYFVHRFSRCMSTTIAVWMNVAFSTTEVICGQTSVGSCVFFHGYMAPGDPHNQNSFAETKVDARRRLMLHIDMCMHIIYNIYIYVYVYVCIGEYTFIFLLLYVFIYIYIIYIYIIYI